MDLNAEENAQRIYTRQHRELKVIMEENEALSCLLNVIPPVSFKFAAQSTHKIKYIFHVKKKVIFKRKPVLRVKSTKAC